MKSGKEIKNFINENDDIYYNIIIINDKNERVGYNDILDEMLYQFIKEEELKIGCGMTLVNYRLKDLENYI